MVRVHLATQTQSCEAPIQNASLSEPKPLTENEYITYHFLKAWIAWEEAHEMNEWMERGFRFNDADSHLYQAIGVAGLKWPWEYRLPRKRET